MNKRIVEISFYIIKSPFSKTPQTRDLRTVRTVRNSPFPVRLFVRRSRPWFYRQFWQGIAQNLKHLPRHYWKKWQFQHGSELFGASHLGGQHKLVVRAKDSGHHREHNREMIYDIPDIMIHVLVLFNGSIGWSCMLKGLSWGDSMIVGRIVRTADPCRSGTMWFQ